MLEQNSALTSLDGLERITELSGTLQIDDNNTALTSVAGLRNLTSIGGDLVISLATALPSIDPTSLRTIGGSLNLGLLLSLTSLSGLDALTSVGRFVTVGDLPKVPDDEILAFLQRF